MFIFAPLFLTLQLVAAGTFEFSIDNYGCLTSAGKRQIQYFDGNCWQIKLEHPTPLLLNPTTCKPNITTPSSTRLVCSQVFIVDIVYTMYESFVSQAFNVTNTNRTAFRVETVQPVRGLYYNDDVSSQRVATNPWGDTSTPHLATFTRFPAEQVGQLFSVKNPFTTYFVEGCAPGIDHPNNDLPGSPFNVASYAECANACKNKGYDVCKGWTVLTGGSSLLCYNKQAITTSVLKNTACSWSVNDGGVPPQELSATYSPHMNSTNASWTADGFVLGTTRLSSARKDPIDFGEIKSFRNVVIPFLQDGPRTASVKVNIGWDENDYQIDIATPQGVVEYTRIFQRNQDLGITHLVFEPSNHLESNRANNTDGWGWENSLWFTLGQKFRMGLWNPTTNSIPKEVRDMINLANQHNIQLMAYIYPILGFRAPGDSDWLFPCGTNTNGICASLASVALQDYLILSMKSLLQHTGMGGFSFDYTFFNDARQPNVYSQWRGWMRILSEVRAAFPNIVIDQRQIAHVYGPWYQLPSSYAEPIAGDENPESYGVPIASLHTDHVIANNLRMVNHNYMMHQMMPVQRIPGFIFHQTERSYANGSLALSDWNIRDFDYLGYKFSLLSSIATAPSNMVVTNIPARDYAEFTYFPSKDITFIRDWFSFADTEQSILQNALYLTKPPNVNTTDVIAAFGPDKGYFFLFNTGFQRQFFNFTMDDSTGAVSSGPYWVFTELYPLSGNIVGVVQQGDSWQFHCDPRTARVIQATPYLSLGALGAVLMGVSGEVILANNGSTIIITNIAAESGTQPESFVTNLPQYPAQVFVNGKSVHFIKDCPFPTYNTKCVTLSLVMCHSAIKAFMPVTSTSYPPPVVQGWFNTTFTIPKAAFEQTQKRNQTYPVPWNPLLDNSAVWLQPNRLLLQPLFFPTNPSAKPTLMLNNEIVDLQAAHTGRDNVNSQASTFTGWYFNLEGHKSDVSYSLSLSIPDNVQLQGVFYENLETEYTNDVC